MKWQVMEIPVEYDDDMERRRTHPLLMPTIAPMLLSWDDMEVLKKVKLIVPAKAVVRFKKGTKQDSTKSILSKRKLVPIHMGCVGLYETQPHIWTPVVG